MSRRTRGRVAAALGIPLLGAGILGVAAGFAGAHLIRVPRVEELANYRPDIITQIRASDGSTIARYAIERRILVGSRDIPPLLKRAIVATEDKNFYRHGGIDLVRLVAAGVKDLAARRYAQGASTLTQQLARAIFLTPQKSIARKVNEAFLAVEIERHYSKDQILTLYCNQIYLGHGNYGVEAAARYYFGKTASQLDLAQTALIAGLIQRPEELSPFRNPDKALQRRQHVLHRMLEERYITRDQLLKASAEPLPRNPSQPESIIAPYFCEDIRQYLEKTYGEKDLYRRGLRVDSTLDVKLQRDAEEALRSGLRQIEKTHGFRKARNVADEGEDADSYADPQWADGAQADPGENAVVLSANRREITVRIGDRRETLPASAFAWTGQAAVPRILRRGDIVVVVPEKDTHGRLSRIVEPEPRAQGAVLIIDNATGAVRAMVGGYDWNESKFNRAVQAYRQTGSSFKPFVYLTALENGFTPSDTLFDAPLSIEIDPHQPPYRPRNYHNDYSGIVTLRSALEHSINIPAVKLARQVGLRNVIETAHRFGIRETLLAYPSIALGAFETTLLEMTTAYSAFANEGLLIPALTVTRVEDANGDVLEQNHSDAREAAPSQAAFQLLWMLKGVIERGTAARARSLGLDNIAGKTGTTNEFTDAWFLGFSPKYTVGVWTGNDEKRLSLGPKMEGSRAALPIWMDILGKMKDQGYLDPAKNFEVPPNISFEAVDYQTGLKATPDTPHPILEAFATGYQPTDEWTPRWEGVLALPWSLQQSFYDSKRSHVPETPAEPPEKP